MSTNEKKASFEQDLKKLESIVSDMESENINLESLVGHYKDGLELIKKCRDKLSKSELLIKNTAVTDNSQTLK
jgi:exodeoxyribonuclease VII small subunit